MVCTTFLSIFIKKIVLQDFNPAYKINRTEILVSKVEERPITGLVQAIGKIEPLSKTSIESLESGRIIKIIHRTGTSVKQGDPILVLFNENLEYEYTLIEESLVREQRNLNLCHEEFRRKEIEFRESLLEYDYLLETLSNRVKRNEALFKSASITGEALENSKKELIFHTEKRAISLEKWEVEKRIQTTLAASVRFEIESVRKKKDLLETRMDRLTVRSPVSGTLNMNRFSPGESIMEQQTIGFVEQQDLFKMTAQIDEFYLSRISIRDRAQFIIKGNDETPAEMELSFISPDIQDSKVQLEFSFTTTPPPGLLSGQSFNIKILQGKPELKRVVEYGSYYKESAGNWVYKIEKGMAVKVPITVGIVNSEYVEILSGLESGDEIIISNYRKYADYDKLIIEEI